MQYGIGASPWCRDAHAALDGGGYDTGFEPEYDDMIGSDTEPVYFGNRGEKSRYMDKHAIVPKKLKHTAPGKTLYCFLGK